MQLRLRVDKMRSARMKVVHLRIACHYLRKVGLAMGNLHRNRILHINKQDKWLINSNNSSK
jgi:tRNA A-37 threonylcarbamoyl transferase component Bud32